MGKEDLKKFFRFLNENTDAAIVAQAIGSNLEAFIAYGRDKGFIFEMRDIKSLAQDVVQSSAELSDAELEMAAGGNTNSILYLPVLNPPKLPTIF